jgi:hypothetical protein
VDADTSAIISEGSIGEEIETHGRAGHSPDRDLHAIIYPAALRGWFLAV